MEDLIPIIIVVGTLIFTALSKIFGDKGQKERRRRRGRSGHTGAEPKMVGRMLQDMMHQAGFEEEQPVAQEHRPTYSEHRPTASEHRPTLSERQPTASEHFRSTGETLATRSEHQVTASEHSLSRGEHTKGDVPVPPGFKPPPPTAHKRKRSKLGQALIADLRGGGRALSRAIMLREILGPPVSMKDPSEQV